MELANKYIYIKAVNYINHRYLELSYIDEHIFMLDKPLAYGLLHDFHIA